MKVRKFRRKGTLLLKGVWDIFFSIGIYVILSFINHPYLSICPFVCLSIHHLSIIASNQLSVCLSIPILSP